ncbi:MAG: hypothetical protein WAU68_03090 [Vitreimonas sp.]
MDGRAAFTPACALAKLQNMDLNTLRVSGIAVSGALIAGAIYIASTAPRVSNRAPTTPAATVNEAPPPRVSSEPRAFAISFRGDGPLARAQRLAMRGGSEQAAQRQVERALARQHAFRGLCFDHFAARGDVVVRACTPTGTGWVARLRAVPAVTNVDPIAQLTHDGRGD